MFLLIPSPVREGSTIFEVTGVQFFLKQLKPAQSIKGLEKTNCNPGLSVFLVSSITPAVAVRNCGCFSRKLAMYMVTPILIIWHKTGSDCAALQPFNLNVILVCTLVHAKLIIEEVSFLILVVKSGT